MLCSGVGQARHKRCRVSKWLTPPQVARARGVKPAKVLAWIATGELEAVNHAGSVTGRPRWRISDAALAAFDRARSNRGGPERAAPRQRVRQSNVIEFF